MQKKIQFELEGETYEVGVQRSGDRLTLTYQGKSYSVSLLPNRVESRISPPAQPRPAVPVPQGSPPAAQAPPPASPPGNVDSSGALYAPMTGVIKEIKVGPGFTVEEGQVVMIMEAMKMDIDVPSPCSGVVAEVAVKVGDTVNASQQLMVIQ